MLSTRHRHKYVPNMLSHVYQQIGGTVGFMPPACPRCMTMASSAQEQFEFGNLISINEVNNEVLKNDIQCEAMMGHHLKIKIITI
jgi:hypothetical protein